jgi:hypothetical protein
VVGAASRTLATDAMATGTSTSTSDSAANHKEEARLRRVSALYDEVINRTIESLRIDAQADGLDDSVLVELKRVRKYATAPPPPHTCAGASVSLSLPRQSLLCCARASHEFPLESIFC